ncbi:Leucine-rich repeat-containing protein 14 [Manis javanica]|nr:Leucine-rich repeat-containing protein 14 [Manis javanica]
MDNMQASVVAWRWEEHILVRFKMDKEPTGTLLELAAKSLLSNEQAAIHALDELPRDLFVPLFIPAFLGRHKEVLKAMTVHLYNLRVSNIRFTCFTETHFETFLNYLGQLDNLQELDLYALFLKDRLPRLLSVLPPQLKTLTLSYCGLSSIDVTILSQSSQATHLRQLNLSHNQILSEAHEPFQALLEKASGTVPGAKKDQIPDLKPCGSSHLDGPGSHIQRHKKPHL